MTAVGEQVSKQIKDISGVVPSFFKEIPHSPPQLAWPLFKRVQFDDGPIPNKYRELAGATVAEIEDAVGYAESSAGWSTYVNGLQMDYDQFKREVLTACKHVRSMQTGEKP